MIIDAHHHFWHYDADAFAWIPDAMAGIRRDFLPADLAPVLAENGVDRVISIQARQTEDETRFLLSQADENPFIAAVVGWLPIASSDLSQKLSNRHPKLKGLRHVVQGEPAGFLMRGDFNRGIATLTGCNLTYDVLILEKQLPETIAFVDRHPNQRFVIDHLAKPRNDTGELEPWRISLKELGQRANVYCKLSGGITEADLLWSANSLVPYLDTALEAFRPERLMFGSNWPLTEAAGGYRAWLNFVKSWAAPLSEVERRAIFTDTAINAYQLNP